MPETAPQDRADPLHDALVAEIEALAAQIRELDARIGRRAQPEEAREDVRVRL
jgi:hypothetical protein